jgi:hypothetical protein
MKNNIIFGLFNILIDKKRNTKTYIYDYLEPLLEFCEKNNKKMFLLTGLKEELANKIIEEHNLNRFFKKENVINITEEYENSLSDLDKQLKQKKYDRDAFHVDEYFKVFYLNNQYLEKKTETLFVGSDVWTDGYYLRRYTGVDFILLEEYLKNNSKEIKKEIFSDLHILNPSLENLKKYLTEEKEYCYASLEIFAKKYLHEGFIGKDFNVFSNDKIKDFVLKKIKK